jgi:hypothetical protein
MKGNIIMPENSSPYASRSVIAIGISRTPSMEKGVRRDPRINILVSAKFVKLSFSFPAPENIYK